MDQTRFDRSTIAVTVFAGRRDALRSHSALGMTLLASLGLAKEGEAEKNENKHKGGAHNHKNRDKHDSQPEGKGKGNM